MSEEASAPSSDGVTPVLGSQEDPRSAKGGNLSVAHLYGGLAALAGVVEHLQAATGSVDGSEDDVFGRFAEVLLDTGDLDWQPKTFRGLAQKMLWRDGESGASIALVRFEAGSGIPSPHAHASNQFMFCLSGRYTYLPTGLTLVPGSFYWNPKGCVHGPTLAEEDSVLIEIYDGPHYPRMPEWYTDPKDAR